MIMHGTSIAYITVAVRSERSKEKETEGQEDGNKEERKGSRQNETNTTDY
jgi:hypothetical protein